MISSFAQKPEKGGTPAIASHATTIATAVYGRNFEAAHEPHVLVIVVAVDHRSGAEEEAPL